MFFPIKDYNPTRRTAYLTIFLIVLNVGIFFYQSVISDLDFEIYKNAMIPWEITHFKNLDKPIGYTVEKRHGLPYRNWLHRDISPFLSLFTSMFMHGSVLHLLGNMLFLWIFGNNIEDFLGIFRFLFFYIIAGLGASLVHILFHPNSLIPVIGASGAVSGVMGAYLILFPSARVRTLVFIFFFVTFVDVPAAVFLIVWFVFQFLYVGGQGVAWLAHVGGFLLGLLMIKWYKKRRPTLPEVIE